MIEAVLVVLTKPLPGRDSDMDDWYSHIHIRDALRFRGSVSAQRFRRSENQIEPVPASFDWQYLALYDVSDPARFSQEHWENALTSRMMVSDAIDDSVLYDFHYYPLQFRDNDPAMAHEGGVILEQIRPIAGREAEFRAWYETEYLPRALRRRGVKSGVFLMFRPVGQLMPTTPEHQYIAIYRVNGSAAVEAWHEAPLLRDCALVEAGTLQVTHWDRIADKLTKDDVLHPTAAALAEEERARARMGARVKSGGTEKFARK